MVQYQRVDRERVEDAVSKASVCSVVGVDVQVGVADGRLCQAWVAGCDFEVVKEVAEGPRVDDCLAGCER